MKRILLFIACMLTSSVMSAQGNDRDNSYFDYLPFVKEGKKWTVFRSSFGGEYHYEYIQLANEDVEKAGKTYMKMYWNEDDLAEIYDERLLREENRKVYLFDSDMQNEFLLFDYSLKAGDTYETYSYDDQKVVSYKVLSVSNCVEGPKVIRYNYNEIGDSMDMQSRYLKKWIVCRTDDNSIQKTWIEGVGSFEGPLANLSDVRPISSRDDLAYVEYNNGDYLPFNFYSMFGPVHGCDLPTGAEYNDGDDDGRHYLTYELEGNRLHVYGKVFTQCGPNNYAYFYEKRTDDPLVNRIEFVIQAVEPYAYCTALHETNFYVSGFDSNKNYIVVDNYGEEHPVVNRTPQMAYRPFIEEGKVWKVGTISGNPVQVVDYYYFDGDTIISGKTCKQMMCQRFVSPDYPEYENLAQLPSLSKVGAWYEEDKKVYFYDEQTQSMLIKYDFSVNPYDTLQLFRDNTTYVVGPKQSGNIKGFKGIYRGVWSIGIDSRINTTWMEGVGGIDGPIRNAYPEAVDPMPEFLMSCAIGDEVIYLNEEYEDGATPGGARGDRFDFTHTIKTKPKAPRRSIDTQSVYGEYNNQQLDINLNLLDDIYLVSITNESSKTVYEKAVNAGDIVGLNIDISTFAKGRYTVTVENSRESFTGEFETQTTGIEENVINKKLKNAIIYNLQGQRISHLQKGLNIVSGQKIYVK